ncbi:putative serine/threonine-protein kinase iks1 [Orbilia oligospora]|uniref:non-specific serine/threonine protein kinase n=1 Tax=Orbilia oligospora TaxID=2813651 RepID=A0A7C8KRL9_ORBOL|nr:putative serine/threonine-protein kinase iks1 [Orbilia oligospora]TGJ73526.1 putative serine/threonine-protein kinase iks1 [Orbilia oligospora]
MDSIVPYRGDSSSVVLRHENSLVVYDHQSRQLALRSTSPPILPHDSPTLRSPTCPYCQQTISDDLAEEIRRDSAASAHAHRQNHTSGGSGSTPSDDTAGFITPEYFRILSARLLPDSNTANSHLSPPGSPRRRIPGLVGAATSGANTPPSPIEDGRSASAAARERFGRSRSSSTHGISSSAFSPGYFNQFFVKERELGKGGKGVVLLVRHVLDGVNLGLFACKRVPVGDDHEWLAKVLQEVQLLQQLSHQNLVSYRHAWLEDMQISNFGPSVPCAFILQQYCNSGDLQNYVYEKKSAVTNDQIKAQLRMRRLSKNGRSPSNTSDSSSPKLLPLDQVISFFRDIAAGLSHLHSNGFIHRDLKPSNCLLHDPGVPGSELRVLVSDFGEVQREDATRRSTGATGTISYCAPEVLRRVGPNGELGNFSTKSDIFSLGMILHFMCFAKLPYINSDEENEENEEIDKLREEISGWQGYGGTPYDKYRNTRVDIPEKLFRSLGRLLSVEPAKRPSAADILGGIRGEFGFAEDGVSRRTPVSPKPPNLSLSDDGRFHRISPVPSGPNTPVINPSNSITRTRNGHLSGKTHTRKSSKLREITSQFNLPEPVSSSSPGSPHNGATNPGEIFGGPLETRVRNPQAGVGNDSSGSSSDVEGPLVPVRTLSSSLILRPKGAASPRALPEKPHLSDEEDDDDVDDYSNTEEFGIGIEMGRVGRSMVMATGKEVKIPALTAPVMVGGGSRSTVWWVRVMPQVWLALKILVFFGKVFSMMGRCSPVTPNPWVFNSLLLLALIDLFGPFLVTTVVLLVLHVAAYYFALKFDALCATDGGGSLQFLQLAGWAAGE